MGVDEGDERAEKSPSGDDGGAFAFSSYAGGYHGLFRSFLLTALTNWRTDQHRANTAQKRGDGVLPLPLHELEAAGGFLPIHDKSDPEQIKDQLGLSKKSFKKAVGSLYKQKKISLLKDGIELKQD